MTETDVIAAARERYTELHDQAEQAARVYREAVETARRAAHVDMIQRWIQEGRTHLNLSNGESMEVSPDQLNAMLESAAGSRRCPACRQELKR